MAGNCCLSGNSNKDAEMLFALLCLLFALSGKSAAYTFTATATPHFDSCRLMVRHCRPRHMFPVEQ